MSVLDGYSPEEIEAGIADLSYHLDNPRLDPIIWRVHGGRAMGPEVDRENQLA